MCPCGRRIPDGVFRIATLIDHDLLGQHFACRQREEYALRSIRRNTLRSRMSIATLRTPPCFDSATGVRDPPAAGFLSSVARRILFAGLRFFRRTQLWTRKLQLCNQS